MKELNTPLSISELLAFHDAVYSFFSEKWRTIERNEGRLKADNWTDKQKKDIKGQGRIPFSMPVNASFIRRIVGSQRNSRQGWRVEAATNPEAEIPAEIGGILLRDYERKNNMKYIESDVFEDGIGKSFGVDKFRIDYSTGLPVIKNEKIDIKNIVWDINDSSYSIEKPQFVAEIERKYRYELEKEYDLIDGTGDASGSLMGRGKIDYYCTGSGDYQIIALFHHYQRVKKTRYKIMFKNFIGLPGFESFTSKKFTNRADAEKVIHNLEFIYAANSVPFDGEAEIQDIQEFVYDYYKFNYNQILEYEETNLEFHPYNFYFSMRVGNDWVSLMDIMSSPQIFIDKMYQQMDHSMRKELKNVLEMDVNRLANGETPTSAARKAGKTGGIIFKKGERVLDVVESRGFNPQYLQVLGVIGQLIADITGGNNVNGLKESANESGRAVALRQQQGKMSNYYFLDNFERYKVSKGWKLLKLSQKYDTAKKILKVAGSELSDEMIQILQENGIYSQSKRSKYGFIKVNDPENALTFLKDADLELVIDTAPMTDYEKLTKLNQMLDAERLDPTLTQLPSWQAKKLEVMDLPKSLIQDLKKERLELMQSQQAFQQQQLNLEKAKVLAGMKDGVNLKEEVKK